MSTEYERLAFVIFCLKSRTYCLKKTIKIIIIIIIMNQSATVIIMNWMLDMSEETIVAIIQLVRQLFVKIMNNSVETTKSLKGVVVLFKLVAPEVHVYEILQIVQYFSSAIVGFTTAVKHLNSETRLLIKMPLRIMHICHRADEALTYTVHKQATTL